MSNFLKEVLGVPRGVAMALTDLPSIANDTALANISGSSTTPYAVSLVSTATPSTIMLRDTNANVQANSFIEGTAVIATSAGTTTLVVGSAENQIFTGSSTQTIVLPNATTLAVGQSFNLFNQSSVPISLEFNGGASFSDAAGRSYSSIAPYTFITVTLQTNGTAAGTWAVSSPSAMLGSPGPTVQKFLSGSGTYTTPANVAFIVVEMVGGGGGGGASGSTGGNDASPGTASTFGTSLLSAGGGTQGVINGNGGAGGTNSIGSGPIIVTNTIGGQGGATAYLDTTVSQIPGGTGGSSFFGGAGTGGSSATTSGQAASANSGSGGGGGLANNVGVSAPYGGSGGGSGGYVSVIINSPLSTYSYSVGAGGAGSAANLNGYAGGAGGSGVIIVTEYYYNGQSAMAGNGGAYTPTVTTLTSGSGTFTTPANASYIVVEMVGGGGGGAGGDNGSGDGGAGGNGGNTTFGTSLLIADGGIGAPGQGNAAGAAGGTASIAAGTTGISLSGSTGGGGGANNSTNSNFTVGGVGGTSPFGGAGGGGQADKAGTAGATNTGSGGGGGGAGGTDDSRSGGGGGSGGYVYATINSPSSTYTYSVGVAGTAGAPSGGGDSAAGAAGGSGIIVVTTYFNNGAVGTATNVTGIVAEVNGGTGVASSVSQNGRYYSSSSSVSSSYGTITYATQDYDSKSAYSGGTLTIQAAGKYQFNAGIIVGATYALDGNLIIGIFKNGTQISELSTFAGGAENTLSAVISDIIKCSIGDLITVKVLANASGPTITASNFSNYFSWAWVGN